MHPWVAIITCVSADIEARVDRLAGLRRIGIDESSYREGHRYLTVVGTEGTRRLGLLRPGGRVRTRCRPELCDWA